MIFRIDAKAVEKALVAAVQRGVAVRALIAHTNSGGEQRLRQLEDRLLAAGVTVSRTGDDLVRYHAKLLIVDRTALHVYGFNCTALDLNRSRHRWCGRARHRQGLPARRIPHRPEVAWKAAARTRDRARRRGGVRRQPKPPRA